MRSINLDFDYDYLYDRRHDKLFNMLTEDYMFKCDNHAVAYSLLKLLDKFDMCEHSDMYDDYWFPYSWIIFITCMPKDIERVRYIAKRIPSSINANIKIFNDQEEEIF